MPAFGLVFYWLLFGYTRQMKKVLLLIFLSLMPSIQAKTQAETAALQAQATQETRLSFSWRENLETLALAALLARPELASAAYQQQLLQEFKPFENLPAVLQLREWLASGLQLEQLSTLALVFEPLSQGKKAAGPRLQLSGELLEQISASQLKAWWAELQDFYRQSKLAEWLQKHRFDYQLAQTQLQRSLPRQDLLALQEAYHRRSFASYEIVYSLLLPSGARYSQVLKSGNQAYLLLGPLLDVDNRWTFADGENLIDAMLRDFGQAFCQPVLEANRAQVLMALAERPDWAKQLNGEGWLRLQQTLLVYAIQGRLILKLYGPEAYEQYLQAAEAEQYPEVRPIAEALADYEADKTLSLTWIYPRLLEISLQAQIPAK